MLNTTKKLDYGVMIMLSLPEQGSQDFRSLKDIAEEKNLSAGFLGQLMIPLKKSGLVHSKEGVNGGYQLSKNKAEISLKEIYSSLEGDLALTNCLGKTDSCHCEEGCPSKGVWSELQSEILTFLEKKTLADI